MSRVKWERTPERLAGLGPLALALLLFAGCGQQLGRSPAGVQGVTSMVKVGELVFIPSLANSEVRVLDLSSDPRDFVRAPNPLEPLSIPVLKSPQAIAKDVAYGGLTDQGGVEVSGPYVYAWSPGSREVSVIGANPDSLVELVRLQADGPITALAARGSLTGGNSTLYIATVASPGGVPVGVLQQVSLPPPPALLNNAGLVFGQPLLVTDIGSGKLAPGIVDVILPLPGDGEQLVISTRDSANTNNNSPPADTVWFQRSTPATAVPLAFTSQVRQLQIRPATAARSVTLEDGGTTSTIEVTPQLNAGQRIYGLLDEEACGAQPACSGLQAVDSSSDPTAPTFTLALDASGEPMITLHPTAGRPTSFLVAPDGGITVPGAGARLFDLGFLASGTNNLLVFNSGELRVVDLDPGPPTVEITASPGLDAGGFISAVAAEGTARNDTVSVTFGAVVATFPLEPFSSIPSGPFPTNAGGVDVLPNLQVNDRIVFEDAGTDCDAGLFLMAAGDGGVLIPDMSLTPVGCQDRIGFSYVAGPDSGQPFVVFGTNFGFYGRMAANSTLTDPTTPGPDAGNWLARYYFHPGFAAVGPFVPQPSLSVTLANPQLSVGQGYSLSVSSHFILYDLVVPPAGVPASMVHDALHNLLEVAYPAVDGVAEGSLLSPDVSQMFPASGVTYQ